MKSRDSILKNLNTDAPKRSLEYKLYRSDKELKSNFKTALENAGAKLIKVTKDNLEEELSKLVNKSVATIYNYNIKSINPNNFKSAKELENIESAIVHAKFGVSENGAVWINEPNNHHRAIYTIVKRLIIILEEKIVGTMAEAYDLISNEDINYGLFISGPSKTADIEQTLVIGAHGAKETIVVLITK